MSDTEYKKPENYLIDVDSWTNKYVFYGKPSLLNKGVCTREEKEPPNELIKVWTEFRTQMKTISRWVKSDRRKQREEQRHSRMNSWEY